MWLNCCWFDRTLPYCQVPWLFQWFLVVKASLEAIRSQHVSRASNLTLKFRIHHSWTKIGDGGLSSAKMAQLLRYLRFLLCLHKLASVYRALIVIVFNSLHLRLTLARCVISSHKRCSIAFFFNSHHGRHSITFFTVTVAIAVLLFLYIEELSCGASRLKFGLWSVLFPELW